MITPQEEFITDLIKKSLVGVALPNTKSGEAGRAFEDKIEEMGININRGRGVDCKEFDWEFKTRHENAVSSQTVGTMLPENIVAHDNWYDTPIAKKIKKQLRATLDENSIIIDVDLIDFDQPHIQDLFEQAYNHARNQIIQNPKKTYTSCNGGYYGYFENTAPSRTRSLDWRISDSNMDKLKKMATSTFQHIFTYDY